MYNIRNVTNTYVLHKQGLNIFMHLIIATMKISHEHELCHCWINAYTYAFYHLLIQACCFSSEYAGSRGMQYLDTETK